MRGAAEDSSGGDAPWGRIPFLTRTTFKLSNRRKHDPSLELQLVKQFALSSATLRPPRLRVKKGTFDGRRCWRREGIQANNKKRIFAEIWETRHAWNAADTVCAWVAESCATDWKRE